MINPLLLKPRYLRIDRIDGRHVYIAMINDMPLRRKAFPAGRRIFRRATTAKLYAVMVLDRYIRMYDAMIKNQHKEASDVDKKDNIEA